MAQLWQPLPNSAPPNDLATALNNAQGDDTISLQAGANYTVSSGWFLGARGTPGHPIIIQSSDITSGGNHLPALNPAIPWLPSQRITPAHAPYMAKLSNDPAGKTPVLTTNSFSGAPIQWVYFRGIEFTCTDSSNHSNPYNYYLVRIDGPIGTTSLGNANVSIIRNAADQPNNITFDQCWVHAPLDTNGNPTNNCEIYHGMLLEGTYICVKNSRISGIQSVGSDCQALWLGSNSTGPIVVINSFVEGSTETIMWGSGYRSWDAIVGQLKAAPGWTTQPLAPASIDLAAGWGGALLYNTIRKNPNWNINGPSFIQPGPDIKAYEDPNNLYPAGKPWSVKNMLEFKNGMNILVEQNLFQYMWVGTQQRGEAVVINLSVYGSSDPLFQATKYYEQVRHITVRNNIVDKVAGGLTIAYGDLDALGGDGSYSSGTAQCGQPLTHQGAISPGAPTTVYTSTLSSFHKWLIQQPGYLPDGSTQDMFVGAQVIINKGLPDQETVTVQSVPNNYSFTAIFNLAHSALDSFGNLIATAAQALTNSANTLVHTSRNCSCANSGGGDGNSFRSSFDPHRWKAGSAWFVPGEPTVQITAGLGAGQTRVISDNNTCATLTLQSPWNTIPASNGTSGWFIPVPTYHELLADISFTNNLFTNYGWQYSNGKTHGTQPLFISDCTGVIYEHNTFRMDPAGAGTSGGSGSNVDNLLISTTTNVLAAIPGQIVVTCGPYTVTDRAGYTSPTALSYPGLRLANNVMPTGSLGYCFNMLKIVSGTSTASAPNDLTTFNATFPQATMLGNVLYHLPGDGGGAANLGYGTPANASGSTNTLEPSTFTSSAFNDVAINFTASSPPAFPLGDAYGNAPDWTTLSAFVQNFALANGSNYKNKASDGTDPGVKVSALIPGAPATTSTSVSGSPNPSTAGQAVQITATVTPLTGTTTPTGTVTFVADNSVTLGTGPLSPSTGSTATATLSTSSLTQGSHSIAANYAGTGSYAGTTSSGTYIQTVNPVAGAATTTAVTASLNPVNVGQSVTFTAAVNTVPPGAAPTPTGTVQFSVDATNLGLPVTLAGAPPSATSIAWNTAGAPATAGNHTVTAVYTGDSTYSTSTGTLPGGENVNSTTVTFAFKDRVQESIQGPVTGGTTGPFYFQTQGPEVGNQAFAVAFTSTQKFYYCAQNAVAGVWEDGIGQLSGGQIQRVTVLANSSGNLNWQTFPAGIIDIYHAPTTDFFNAKKGNSPIIYADRVQESTLVGWGGTGNISLGGAETGYRTFASQLANGQSCYYELDDTSTGAWEVGLGIYNATPNTLTRQTVLASSANNGLVNFGTAHIKDVRMTVPSAFWAPFDSLVPPGGRVYYDRVQEVHNGALPATAGSTVPLMGPAVGFRAFSSVLALGNTFYYGIQDTSGTWEIGQGTYTAASILRRDRVINSSAAGAFVAFNSTTQNVYMTIPSELLAAM